MEGKLLEGGWEKINENFWYHPVAEVARRLEEDGSVKYYNSLGEPVEVFEDNDAKRRAEPLVGRPDTAKNPKDPKSRLAKQAAIKTRIIDETKRVLDLLEKQFPKKKDDKDDKKPNPKAKDNDGDDDDKKEKDKKPSFAKDKGTNRSPATKAEDDRLDKEFKKDAPKDKDGSIDDDKNPKELEGGKTDVDTHPTTDDNLTPDTKDTAKGDKEAKKQNKKIGAKGASKKQKDDVKEETITEISRELSKRYLKRAIPDKDDSAYKGDAHRWAKRTQGIKRAKETREFVGMRKEEVFSEEELAYFDLVEAEEKKKERKSAADKKAGRFVDMSKKNVDQIINEKGKPHRVYTATNETRHGLGIDELMTHLGVGDSPYIMKKFMHNLHTAGVRTGWSHSAGKFIAYHGKKI
jgi:hypothetical protein